MLLAVHALPENRQGVLSKQVLQGTQTRVGLFFLFHR